MFTTHPVPFRLVGKVKEVLVEAREGYFEATRLLAEGETDEAAITKGAGQAANICFLYSEALPEALNLVR